MPAPTVQCDSNIALVRVHLTEILRFNVLIGIFVLRAFAWLLLTKNRWLILFSN